MQLSASRNLETICRLRLFYAERNIGIQLPEKTVTNMPGGHELSFGSCKRGIVDHEIHGNCRLGNLLERKGRGILLCTNGIPDMEILNSGNSHNITESSFLHIHTF